MSDAVVTPAGASAVVDTTSGQGTAPPAAAAASSTAPPDEKPSWLDARLERERAKILKDLGVDSLDTAKKALDQVREVEEKNKSDAQKRGELESTLKQEREEKKAMADALGTYAKGQMSSLTDAQRAAVEAVAGDDPAKQLKTLEALRPTWASAAAPAAEVTPPPKAKDTAVQPTMPKDGVVVTPADPKAVHEELQRTNPVLAARYAIQHGLFENKK